MYDFFNDTLAGRLLSKFGTSNNNRWINQPYFTRRMLNFNRNEEWVSIDGNEMEIYNTTPELRLVIDRLALMFSNGVWKHLDANGEEIEGSEYIQLLNNPNVFQSNKEFLQQAWIQRCLYANIFEYNLKSGVLIDEVPTALWNLSPSRMVVNRTGKIWKQTDIEDIISGYTFRVDGATDDNFTPDEIIQYSIPNSDDPLMGVSPLQSLKMPISNIRAAYGYDNVILTKKGAIGMWVNSSKDTMGSVPLTDDEIKETSNQLTKTYGIGDHQASVAISSKDLRWEAATYPTKDLLLKETINAGKKAIIDMYGANDSMFSRGADGKGDTFTNVDDADKKCYQNTIIPFAEDYANGKSKKWGLLEKGECLKLDYSHIPALKDDENQKSEIIKRKADAYKILKETENTSLTDDEIRSILDWE